MGCQNTIIPSTVKIIGSQAFNGCVGLNFINIPDSVEEIQEKVDYFFSQKQGVDADLLIGISKALKENLDYFCISHIEDESLSIEQEKLVELMEVCKKNFDVKSVEVNEKLYELENYAYDNELISFSMLQYYLN